MILSKPNIIKNKIFLFTVGMAFCMGLYLMVNHLNIYPPFEVPKTFIDNYIPFVPWTIWIYLSLFPFIFIILFSLPSNTNLIRLYISVHFLIIVSCLIFIFFPTTVPRDPLFLTDGDLISVKALTLLYYVDHPVNCIPSLHVSVSLLFVLTGHNALLKNRLWLWIGFLLITWSTLATKQHYMWDVLIGIITGWGTYKLFSLRDYRKFYYTELN